LEVSDGESHLIEEVEAESIVRAVRLASSRYPRREIKVLFPIDPEAFFATGPDAASEAFPVSDREVPTTPPRRASRRTSAVSRV